MEEPAKNDDLIHFLRQITADGIVDKQEIWDLGTLLQVNDDARTAWPGPVIWEILQQIFADKVVSDEEAEDLTVRLRQIEKECHDRSEAEKAEILPETNYTVRELELPAIDMRLEIESTLPNESPARVDLGEHTCTCSDWNAHRKSYGANSIGRLCRCMSTAFERALNGRPELYDEMGATLVNLIRLLSTYGLGGIAEAQWRLLEGGGFNHFVSWDEGDWIAVFTENDEGLFERFGFNRRESRWAFGVRPLGAGALLDFISGLESGHQPIDGQ
jgi:hypothetical protein